MTRSTKLVLRQGDLSKVSRNYSQVIRHRLTQEEALSYFAHNSKPVDFTFFMEKGIIMFLPRPWSFPVKLSCIHQDLSSLIWLNF